ncbi:phage antirepressor [Lactococcus formosensis]|uniref:Phage antirepressor KilAC domain-containing protein n=1 Tax=Lactococcus formosensis TaxID=1281486 RepID=A0A9X4NXZ7_9LACT|nr:phage antirepressor KilAC domain-containing protein [Lactococcus formosensis]MDG6126414.1 phage antirepressor KilAC domain-containing protein [Lactococcus formosensis]MDG6131898.1 phage antirepressor KilAC domain-containing protein [Lactococcus formosensis]MDG6133895.1 phage antirepressor KilAC domain-containing protein [Lactococcus formosensis]MDG6140479.1 phage antirepressor KilAC domain-containing protein [Lactococcus formosensis]MDG6145021.1 phage antirepressor KilAC domain-containing p
MNQLQNFNFNNLQVRTILIDKEPWFVVADVAKIIEATNPTDLAKLVDDEDKSRQSLGSGSPKNIINESGLYQILIRSNNQNAKPFRKWVTREVLPSIRKHGAYMTSQTIENTLSDPDFIIRLATELKEERAARAIEAPKVLFADSVAASQNSILVRDLAKIIKQNGVDIGEKRLFSWLRENGYLVKKKGNDYNSPTQRSMDLGVLEFTENIHHHNSGMITVTKTPKVTGKGQVYFANKFLKNIA